MNVQLRRGLRAAGMQVALAASTIGLVSVAGADDDYRGNGRDQASHITPYAAQMAARTAEGWATSPIFTIGESVGDYTPPGIPDGMYAWKRGKHVQVLVNHELRPDAGYPYRLNNGAQLTGARVSYFNIERDSRRVTDAGLAFDKIYNRAGRSVRSPADLEFGGLARLCSANGISAGELGFVDDIFFTGEETDGGTEFALDVQRGDLWAAPALGRAAWESVTAIEPPSSNQVALIVGDDRAPAPLILYVGEKTSNGRGKRQNPGSFLTRNGLAEGKLYVWVSDSGDANPTTFNGNGTSRTGDFVEIDYYRPDLAGNGDYDALGYATQDHQDDLAATAGAFLFSRPEDVGTNPADSSQVVLASTGRSGLFGDVDYWGTTYKIDVSYQWNGGVLEPTAELTILYDGDDSADPDNGLRSPDNLVWSSNGLIYLQEDDAVPLFGTITGQEASIWELDPDTGWVTRVAQIDRNAVSPAGVSDGDPFDVGDWESSGVIDVTALFPTEPGEVLLLANTQAHSLRDGVIGGSSGLVEGGQLYFLNFWAGIEPLAP